MAENEKRYDERDLALIELTPEMAAAGVTKEMILDGLGHLYRYGEKGEDDVETVFRIYRSMNQHTS